MQVWMSIFCSTSQYTFCLTYCFLFLKENNSWKCNLIVNFYTYYEFIYHDYFNKLNIILQANVTLEIKFLYIFVVCHGYTLRAPQKKVEHVTLSKEKLKTCVTYCKVERTKTSNTVIIFCLQAILSRPQQNVKGLFSNLYCFYWLLTKWI